VLQELHSLASELYGWGGFVVEARETSPDAEHLRRRGGGGVAVREYQEHPRTHMRSYKPATKTLALGDRIGWLT